jgi:hypothetical protein
MKLRLLNKFICLFLILLPFLFPTSLSSISNLAGISTFHSLGLYGSNESVCIIGSGVDFSRVKVDEWVDYVDGDWCISSTNKTSGYKRFYLNVPDGLDYLDVGVFWRNITNRYDILIYDSDGNLLFNSSNSNPSFSNGYFYFSKKVSNPIDLVIVVSYSHVLQPEKPIIVWGTNASVNINYYTNSCFSTPNPVTDGDPRAFYNDIAHDDFDNIHGAFLGEIISNLTPKANISVAKILDMNGNVDVDNLVKALKWCKGRGIVLIPSMLNTSFCANKTLIELFANISNNSIIISSSSNAFPSCMPGVLTVGSVDENKHLGAFFSGVFFNNTIPKLLSYGENIELSGTEENAMSSNPNLAAAVVSSSALLLHEFYSKYLNQSLSSDVLFAYLLASGDNDKYDENTGFGVLNISNGRNLNYFSSSLYGFSSIIWFKSISSEKTRIVFFMPEPYGNHSVVKMVVSQPFFGFYLKNNTNAYKHSFYGDGVSDFNVELSFNKTPFTNRKYILVYDRHALLTKVEYGSRVYRRGYREIVPLVLINNNPNHAVQLDGIAVELWNSSGFITDLYILTDKRKLKLNASSSLSLSFPVYIPKTTPPDAFIKIRVFRTLKQFSNFSLWHYGNEGDATSPNSFKQEYNDTNWLPYGYYDALYPAQGRLILYNVSNAFILDPYPTFKHCDIFVNEKRITHGPIPWNSSAIIYYKCPDKTDIRDLRPMVVYEYDDPSPIINPLKPPVEVHVLSSNSFSPGHYYVVKLEVRNNMETDAKVSTLSIDLINKTNGKSVVHLGGITNLNLLGNSIRVVSVPIYISDRINPSPDFKLKAEATITVDEEWDLKCYNWGIVDPWDESNYLLWPAREIEFDGYCKRTLLSDENLREIEVSVSRSTTKDLISSCDYPIEECPFHRPYPYDYPGTVYLYVNRNFVDKAVGEIVAWVAEEIIGICRKEECMVTSVERPYRRVGLNNGVNVFLLNVSDDWSRTKIEDDLGRRPLLTPFLKVRWRYSYSYVFGSLSQSSYNTLSFSNINISSNFSKHLSSLSFTIRNNDNASVFLDGIELIGHGDKDY